MNQTIKGKVIETYPDLKYLVKLEDGSEIKCYVAGRMKINKIKVLIGDVVDVVLDPYGGAATNRIIHRENTA